MDQVNPSMMQDLLESQEAFSDQFDRNSAHFHGGLTVPVPVGGGRVPESMPNVYPESIKDLNGYINQQQPTSFGAEYDECISTREFFSGRLKRNLAEITMDVEALFRHREAYSKQTHSDQEKAKQVFDKNMQKDTLKLQENLNQLNQCKSFLDENKSYKDRYQELSHIHALSQTEIINKDQLGEFNFAVKRITTLSFKDCQLLLEKIKKIKKQHELNNKQDKMEEEKKQ